MTALVVTALVVTALVVAGCSSSAAQPAPQSAAKSPPTTSQVAAATTVTRSFTPYDSDGQLTAGVSAHLSGSCWTTSIALPGPHTYRCLADNQILDPCFAPTVTSGGAVAGVACFANPWTAGVELALTQPLPAADPGTRATPWALQLADGTRCVAVTGTVDQVGALDLQYGCGSSGQAGLATATSAPTLKVEYRASDSQPLHELAVATAWRG